jgi:LPS-assembly lipoprotein
MIKRNLLVIGLALLLGACGFQLRGTGTNQLTIKEIDLSARNAYGEIVTQLRQTLEGSGVRVHSGAPYKLILVDENESQRSLSYTGASGSAEYEMTAVLNYQIHGAQDLSLLDGKLQVQKIYVHDGNNLMGSDQEMEQVRKEMRNQLVQNMMVRLQLLTPTQLEQLQQTADNKAKADADALEAAQKIENETPRQSPIEIPSR